jgi:hypothetical protein
MFAGYWNRVQAQDTKKEKEAKTEAAIRTMVTAQQYVFKALYSLSMSGSTRQLTSEYGVIVSKDSVLADLPYFGTAYTVQMTASGGIDFKSKKFEYTLKEEKKGGWNIMIKPKDIQDTQQLFLSISKSGYATLQVTSNSRQPIIFNGYIAEVTKTIK